MMGDPSTQPRVKQEHELVKVNACCTKIDPPSPATIKDSNIVQSSHEKSIDRPENNSKEDSKRTKVKVSTPPGYATVKKMDYEPVDTQRGNMNERNVAARPFRIGSYVKNFLLSSYNENHKVTWVQTPSDNEEEDDGKQIEDRLSNSHLKNEIEIIPSANQAPLNDDDADVEEFEEPRIIDRDMHHRRRLTETNKKYGIDITGIKPPPRKTERDMSTMIRRRSKRIIRRNPKYRSADEDENEVGSKKEGITKVIPRRITRQMKSLEMTANENSRPSRQPGTHTRSMQPQEPLPVDKNPYKLAEKSIVLAKYGNHPYWPGIILTETALQNAGKWHLVLEGELHVRVFFLSEYTAAWVSIHNVKSFTMENVMEYSPEHVHNSVLRSAISEAIDRTAWSDDEEEMGEELKDGDVVLAIYDGYPPWPGMVEKADNTYDSNRAGKIFVGNEIHIRFFPTVAGKVIDENFVEVDKVKLYSQSRESRTRIRKDNENWELYHSAVVEADENLGIASVVDQIDVRDVLPSDNTRGM